MSTCITLGGGLAGTAAAAYNPIVPTQSGRTVTLDGKSMTIEDVVAIARHGAKVQLTRRHASAPRTPTS